jgi:hypothetical protein
VLGVVAAAVAGAVVIALSDTRAIAAAEVEDEDTEPPVRWWTNHADGYWQCGHRPCSKKISSSILDHDCCGRCWRGRECLVTAQRDYDGPGGFAHRYFETPQFPGVCTICDEPPEAHEGYWKPTR